MKSVAVFSEFNQLPLRAQEEAADFIRFLKQKYSSKPVSKSAKLDFSWEGGLSELNKSFTSVELQHKASEWR